MTGQAAGLFKETQAYLSGKLLDTLNMSQTVIAMHAILLGRVTDEEIELARAQLETNSD